MAKEIEKAKKSFDISIEKTIKNDVKRVKDEERSD